MKVKSLTRDEVFERLLELDRQYSIRPNDVTLSAVCKKFHWGKDKSERYLDFMVKAKELIRLELLTHRGKTMSVWRIPE